MRATLSKLSLPLCLLAVALPGCSKTKSTAEPTQSASMTQSAKAPQPAEPAAAAAAAPAAAPTPEAKAAETAPASATKVVMTTNKGAVTIELDAAKAPKSVANFLRYARDKHFDGTVFHRVIPNFMIQGGGFDPSLSKKPTRAPVANEADNGLKNDRGTLAMARTSDPHSASAQFFINLKNNDFLNFTSKTPRGWGYTVFGKVTSGMEVVDAIGAVKTGGKGPFRGDVPQQDIVIESMRVVE